MLSIAGATLPDDRSASALIGWIQKNPSLHLYVVHKLFWALHEDRSQLALAHVALWCMGEYGAALLEDPPTDEETTMLQGKARVEEPVVIHILVSILKHPAATDTTRAYGLTAALKLTTRFRHPESIEALSALLLTYHHAMVSLVDDAKEDE